MSPAPDLRLVACEECERSRQALDATLVEIQNLQMENRSLRARIGALRTENAREVHDSPNFEVAEQLFEFWRQECGHPNATFGPKRQKAVLARLRTYSPRDIAMAIKGAAVGAYVDEKGTRHDDLELICRDEVKLEKFIERYQRWKETRA